MLFLEVFKSNFYILMTLAAFVALLISLRKTRFLEQSKSFVFFSVALSIFLTASALRYYSAFFYTHGVPFKIYILSEIILILLASLLLLMSAQWLMFKKLPGILFTFCFITFGLCLTLYVLFLADDALLLVHIRQILPMICMSCVALAFLACPKLADHHGQILTGIVAAAFIGLMFCPLAEVGIGPWFISVDLVVVLALSFYISYTENLSERFQQLSLKQEKNVADIENIVRFSPFPILIAHLNDDRLMLANRNAVKIFGLNENELQRYRFKDFFVDADNLKLFFERLEKNAGVQNFEILVQSVAVRTPFWLLVSANVMDYKNNIVLYAAFQDITDRKRREDLLQSQADRDPMTSVFNRRYFETALGEKILRARRQKQPFAVLMLDADHFKNINDTYGHKIGDKVLMELAAVCERQLRADDLLARYGGEEFVAFLNNVDTDTAILVADRLRSAIGSSVVYTENREQVRFSVSIGIAPSGISDSPDALIKMADDAMYLAKKNGRNRIETYSAEKIEEAKRSQPWTQVSKTAIHPAYSADEGEEISLLDGIESTHIIED